MGIVDALGSPSTCLATDCVELLPIGANPRRIYCSQRCAAREYEIRRSAVRRSLPDYVIGTNRKCLAPGCDKTFSVRIHNQTYCDRACYRKAQSAGEIAENCRHCGGVIPTERRSRRVRYCQDECAAMAKREQAALARRVQKDGKTVEVTLISCESCEQLIPKRNADHNFCKSCRTIGRKARALQVSAKDAFQVWLSESCEACGEAFDNRTRGRMSPVLDHNHITGVVRGKIHSRCNLALGVIGDDPHIAMMLGLYLLRRGSS